MPHDRVPCREGGSSLRPIRPGRGAEAVHQEADGGSDPGRAWAAGRGDSVQRDRGQLVWGYDINGPAPELTDAEAIQIARNLIGDQEVPIRIKSASLWTVNHLYATRYSSGRVFCMGDAVHRHPPSNGLGSNTSIQDAYNLAWKLALVTGSKADPALLDSYDAERAPIGCQIVTRANKSIEEFGPIFEALGLLDMRDAAQMLANMEARKAATSAGGDGRKQLPGTGTPSCSPS